MAQRPRTLNPDVSQSHLLGARLRALREQHQLSQAKLGELVFCSGHLIGKIEKAERTAQADLIQRCDDVLGADGQLTSMLLSPNPGDSRSGGTLDPDLIESRRVRYEQMYRHVGGIPVRPRIEQFLNSQVRPALQDSTESPGGLRLRRAASALVAVAGICAYDAEEHTSARRHFRDALQLAESAHDPAWAGYVRALMANQALCLSDYRLAIRHSESALRDGRGALSPALRTDLHAMHAKAHAQLDQQSECFKQLRNAEAAAASIAPDDEPVETSYVHPGLFELKNAEALLRIGDPMQARIYAEESLRLGPTDPRGHFYGYATLAQVLASDHQPDESLEWAQKAFAVTAGMESWRVVERLKIVLDALEPYSALHDVNAFLSHARHTLSVPF